MTTHSKKTNDIKRPGWYIIALCIFVMILSISISVDLIRAEEKLTVVENLEISKFKSQTKQGRYITTGYSSKVICKDLIFNVKSKKNFLNIRDTIFVKYTPYYKFIIKFNLYRFEKIFDKSPPEGTFILLHFLSFLIFIICILVIFIDHGRHTVNLISAGIFLLIILYFFFVTGNYFEPYS